MKLFAPKYYTEFKCIADKCNHSCCVGWEIDIDKDTLNKYNSLSCEYAKSIKDSIVINGTPHFKLSANERCVHLDENGLCKIIKNVGEEYLSNICSEHPRFYNYTNHSKELGIGISCEEACRLIISSDDFDQMVEIADIDGEIIKYDFDAIKERDYIYKILKESDATFDKSIINICEYFGIDLCQFDFTGIISKLEYLDVSHKTLFTKAKKLLWKNELTEELNRLLAYFVYRHCSEACYYDEFCNSLLFSIFCTGLISTLANKDDVLEISRIVSEEIEYSEDNIFNIKTLLNKEIEAF